MLNRFFILIGAGVCLMAPACHVNGALATVAPRWMQESPRPYQADSADEGSRVLATNLKGFGVPFRIDANDGAFIEVQLYLSRDQGRHWSFYGRQTTDQREFPFESDGDGEYWFSLKTLNRDRRLLPAGQPQPELKIIVDTRKPTLDFRVQTDQSGRVVCRWQAEDTNLEPGSLKLFYQPVMSNGALLDWIRVPVELKGAAINGVYSDQLGWWPDTAERAVQVACEIQDAAGNVTRVDRRVELPQTAWRSRSLATALPTASTQPNSPAADATGTFPQPDWAKPGWSPSERSPTTPLDPQVAAKRPLTSNSHESTKPGNVVCEDGVCRLVDSPASSETGNLQSPQRDVANRSESQSRFPDPWGIASPPPRSASRGGVQVPLVGSDEEYVDPPAPERILQRPVNGVPSIVPSHPVGNRPEPVRWPSQMEPERPRTDTGFGTTRTVDPSITPAPQGRPVTSPATAVPANPSRMEFQGNQVISESSTMTPNNQYRGLPVAEPPARPVLAPGSGKLEALQPPSFPTTNQPGFQESTDQGAIRRLPTPPPGNAVPQATPRPMSPIGFRQQEKSVVESSQRLPANSNSPDQIIGSKRFRLNYGIDSIDPSGVGRVQLWMTRDEGRTWDAWGTDPDQQSPFPVQVEEEGQYGFRIVVHSKDGLSGQGPASGDDADIWVTIDTQAPLAQITSVPYGRGSEAGRLIINYSVADPLLTLRPITLSYARQPDGPWQVIEAGVRNDGRYVWQVNREIPDQIYLRIEAIDRAGNVGTHELQQPIDVSGLVPRGTIHGVTPVGQ